MYLITRARVCGHPSTLSTALFVLHIRCLLLHLYVQGSYLPLPPEAQSQPVATQIESSQQSSCYGLSHKS